MAKRHTKSSPSPAAPDEAAEADQGPEGIAQPEVSNLESYLEDHRGKIAIIGILAVVAIAVTSWVIYTRSAKEKEAAIEFTRASTVADYNLVIERHGGTVAGGNAAIMKAKLQWDSGEQTASLKTLNQFIGNFPDHPFKAQGLYAIAVREAAMDNDDVATQRLKEVVADHADTAVAPLAQLYLADMALGDGDVETARSLYDAAAKMDPAVVSVVERRIDAINSKTPIVAIDAPPLPKEEEKPPIGPVVPPNVPGTSPAVPPTTPPVPPTTPPVPPTTPPVPPTTPAVPPTTPAVPPTTPPVPPTTPPVPPTTPPVPPTTPPVSPTTPPVPPTTPPVPPTTPPVPPTTPPVPPTTPPAPPTTPPVPPTTPPVPPTTPPVPPTTPPVPPTTPPVPPTTPPVPPTTPPVPPTPPVEPAPAPSSPAGVDPE